MWNLVDQLQGINDPQDFTETKRNENVQLLYLAVMTNELYKIFLIYLIKLLVKRELYYYRSLLDVIPCR